MKSIHGKPSNEATEGDERTRTAVCEPGADSAYEALRRIADARIEYRRDGHGFAHHLVDENGCYLGHAAPALQQIAREALEARDA